jgi:xylulokinase
VSVLLGLDIGTGGARAVAVDEDGVVVSQASASYDLARPRPGWTEQRPEDWWDAARTVLRAVAEPHGDAIAGLGLTGQMHGSVFLDSRDRVIRPALLWNDQRTSRQAETIEARVGLERLVTIAGNPSLTGFQAPKILWLADEEPENYARVAHVLLPKDYVRLRLTGERATDASDASGTLLLDLRSRDWSPEILDALEIPGEWLPTVFEGTDVAGGVRDDIARELGLPPGLPVAAGGGDNAAAAVGLGIVRDGLVSSSIGTSGVVFAHRDALTPDPALRIHASCHAFPGAYHLMGVTLSAGAALDWWRGLLGDGSDFEAIAAEAESAPPGARGLLFAPYLAGERTPHRDPAARGAFVGLTAAHGRPELARAIMEGVTFSLREGLDAMREVGVPVDQIRAIGGGAKSPLWRQLQADIFGVPVRRTVTDEGAAYGAALLAGVASGRFTDIADATRSVRLRPEVTEPDEARVARYDDLYAHYRELYLALRATMHALSEFDETPSSV